MRRGNVGAAATAAGAASLPAQRPRTSRPPLGHAVDALDPEALADALGEIWRLDDDAAVRRRLRAAAACEARYGAAAVGPALHAALLG